MAPRPFGGSFHGFTERRVVSPFDAPQPPLSSSVPDWNPFRLTGLATRQPQPRLSPVQREDSLDRMFPPVPFPGRPRRRRLETPPPRSPLMSLSEIQPVGPPPAPVIVWTPIPRHYEPLPTTPLVPPRQSPSPSGSPGPSDGSPDGPPAPPGPPPGSSRSSRSHRSPPGPPPGLPHGPPPSPSPPP